VFFIEPKKNNGEKLKKKKSAVKDYTSKGVSNYTSFELSCLDGYR